MELSPLHIYLFSVFDSLNNISSVVILLSIVAIVFMVIFASFSDDHMFQDAEFKTKLKLFLIALACSVLCNTFVPSGKTMIAMYTLPKVVNNEALGQLPSEVLDFIKQYLNQNKKEE